MTLDIDTEINIKDINILFELAYEQEYALVDDNLGNRFTVPLEELMEVRPGFKNEYVRVYYYGQGYWLHKNFYFI